MKQEIIWNLQDILDSHENLRLDLEMDLNNSELLHKKKEIKNQMKVQSAKIKELKDCIKWINSIK